MLSGKHIVLGVTGSIAAYKIANLASMLVKLHASVHVIMTKNATNFITPMTFETLTGNKCIVDTFDRNFDFSVKHISLAQLADIFMVAPATANILGKVANGICDDMLSTTIMATKAPVVFAPAMNTGMWDNAIQQDNLKKLQRFGYHIIQPAEGRLACGDVGRGKMPSEDVLLEHILLHVAKEKDMKGRRVLISAGPTQESIDPVRFITNHSSGKMGYAIAKMARLRGAEVTIVSGPVGVKPFADVNVVKVKSAADMYEGVTSRSADSDIIIMCAAVADYTPAVYHDQKVKKSDDDMSIALTRTQDILKYLGEHKREGQKIIGFSMETENMLENSRKKLEKKNADMICANSVTSGAPSLTLPNGEGVVSSKRMTGFGVDTNQVTLITTKEVKELPLCSKEETADMILDAVMMING